MTPDPTLASTIAPDRDAAVRALLIDQVAHDVPARSPRAARRTVMIGSAAAAAAALTAVVVLNNPDEPRTYAAWTAIPVTAPGANVSSDAMEQWASSCSDLGVGGVSVQGVPANPEAAAARKVLVDRRGSYTYCLDISPGSGTARDPLMAISGLVAEAGREEGLSRSWSTVYDRPFTRPAADGVLVLGGDTKASPDQSKDPDVISLRTYQLYGMAGRDVRGVDIVLANGLRITATLDNGRWGAWWPTEQGAPDGLRLEVDAGQGPREVDPADASLAWDRQ